MRRVLALSFVLLVCFGMSLAVSGQDTPAPLHVVGATPEPGSSLSGATPIRLLFDRAVDCTTASDGITLQPAVAGSFSCEVGATAEFTPSEPYPSGVSLTVTVNDNLRAADNGAGIAEPFAAVYQIAGDLLVTSTLPTDGSKDVSPDALITVIFNRPVVALTTIGENANQPSPITISPAVEGVGEWLNTSIYTFRAAPALAGGTPYTVTVNPGLTAADGSALAEPYSFQFTTAAPAVTGFLPDSMTTVQLDQTVQVTFSSPVDRAAAEAAFSLHLTDENNQPAGDPIPGKFRWADDSTGFQFTPDQPLQLGTTYRAEIAGGQVTSPGGGAPMAQLAARVFDTVPLPSVLNTDPFDGQTDVPTYTGFGIYFASQMDVDSLDGKVTIDPEPIGPVDNYYDSYSNQYRLSFGMEPSADYTVTIAPGMQDIYGNAIEDELAVHFTTAPYDSSVSLQAPGDMGFYNAYNEETSLFVAHRNVDSINFTLDAVPDSALISAFLSDPYYSGYSIVNDLPAGDLERLRSWTLQSEAPLNALRYDLLSLGSAAPITCTGAPATRLAVGDVAEVISDPDPVRARATPADGEIVTLLYKGYALPIIGGPLCEGDALWWEVQLRDGQTAWVAEGAGDEYFLDLQSKGEQTPVVFEGSGALEPGMYLLRVSSPSTNAIYGSMQHLLFVSTTVLTMKTSPDEVVVWATDAQTGQPVPNAPITIYDAKLGEVGSGVTDADGLVRVSVPRAENYQARMAVLDGGGQFGVSLSNWSSGIEPYSFGVPFNPQPAPYNAYLYTDRPIYRPDQPVYFRGILRAVDDAAYTPSGEESVEIGIYEQNSGELLYTDKLPLTEFGTFSGEYHIAADAPLGYYRIAVQLPNEDGLTPYGEAGVSFGVAEYRAPEFQVTVTPNAAEVAQGDTISATVEARYFFGGAVSGGTVEYNVVATPYTFNYTGPGYYSFGDYDLDAGSSEFYYVGSANVTSGTVTLDQNGRAVIEFPAELKDVTQSVTYTLEATVSDESGQAVSGRAEVIGHKGLLYVGVRSAEYVATAGSDAAFDLIAVDWDSQPIANQPLQIEVVERRWSSVQEQDDYGRTVWTWEVEEVPVTTGEVTTGADGKAEYSFTPEAGGVYKLRASTTDTAGNTILAADQVWVAGPEYVPWRQQNSNRIDLVTDKRDYNIGDTAQILITSPFQGASEALITVERGGVLTTERVTMENNSYVYELPITEDFAPVVYVSAVIVHGVDENNPVAAFRMGLAQLNVENTRKQITLDVSTDVEQAGPGDTVNYTIRATDYAGNPVSAEIGVSLTDLAVLTIADPNSVDLLDFYYGSIPLSVLTSTPLTINVDMITQTVIDTIKGGGGGYGEGGIFDIREEFVDTPLWNPSLVTDANGEVHFPVTLPDNLTTWRLDARAVTSGENGGTLVGQTTYDLLSTKPVLIRPVTPRFFVAGDEVVLGAVVNNNTSDDLTVEVGLEANGVTVAEGTDAVQTVAVAAGTRVRVDWPVTVTDAGAADLTFYASADNGAYTDASKPPLGQGDGRLIPILRYSAPETTGTSGVLEEAGSITEAVTLPPNVDTVTGGSLDVSLQPSLAATTLDALDVLKNFPHQCIEQTISRFLPNIMTYRALDALNLSDPAMEQSLEFTVNQALQKLAAEQKVDGGWGWFVNDPSNPLVTAYALIGLTEAQAQGFAVEPTMISGAQSFVQSRLIPVGTGTSTSDLNRQAFLLYALAYSGEPDVARTSSLYELRTRLSYYAQALLAMTLHLTDPAGTRAETLLSDLANNAALSATGAHWDEAFTDTFNWNTDTRSTALVLEAFLQIEPDNGLLPNVVRWLVSARRGDGWETTQETAWSVMALTDWMTQTGELDANYTYNAALNGDTLTEGQATPETVKDTTELSVAVGDLLVDEINNLVISRGEGPGNLYYTAHLNVYLPVADVEPVNQGIILERRYTLPGENEAITSAQVGDTVQVHLTIIAPNDLNYVVIEDPIPAGSDAVDPNLNTSQQIGTQPELNRQDPLSEGWGWWWFSRTEFRDEKVVLYASYLPAGTYEFVYTLRAGLEGTYNVIPPTGQEFYFPEVYGRGAGSQFTVTAAE